MKKEQINVENLLTERSIMLLSHSDICVLCFSSPCPSVPPQWVRPQHGVLSSGKRPVSVFYRRHRHGVPRGGWAQAGTHHCLPLHWRSVARLFLNFLWFQETGNLSCSSTLSCLLSHPACFALLSLSFTQFHFLLPTFCPVFSLTDTLSYHALVSLLT